MAFDGIMTWAVAKELATELALGKIEKIYQPEKDGLLFFIHTKQGRKKLFASASSNGPRVCLTSREFQNPEQPPLFCMTLRKHLQGGRIDRISQRNSERIIEMDFQVLDELGFEVSKRLIFEIMGKHSNIVLVNLKDNRIIDSIKRISIDVNRARQLLPGLTYAYPPVQGKVGFKEFLNAGSSITVSNNSIGSGNDHAGGSNSDSKADSLPPINWADPDDIMDKVGGISPRASQAIAWGGFSILKTVADQIDQGKLETKLYRNDRKLLDFHILPIYPESETEAQTADPLVALATDSRIVTIEGSRIIVDTFPTPSGAVDSFFELKEETNSVRQAQTNLQKHVKGIRDKLGLKLQRMEEDVLKAKDSEDLRLYGELLTANLHLLKKGDNNAKIVNYYTGETVDIKLDTALSPSENAQKYYWRYGKAMNTIKEKKPMIESVRMELDYIDSVLEHLDMAETLNQVEDIREELVEEGYLRRRANRYSGKYAKNNGRNKTNKKNRNGNLTGKGGKSGNTSTISRGRIKSPITYTLSSGMKVIVGRNNKENDVLTMRMASKADIWFHTKDIPGSHAILLTDGVPIEDIEEKSPESIKAAASIAAYHSNGKSSENVPVDYTQVRFVKKPSGAKPGMVIFKNNKTLWVTPKLPLQD